MLIQIKKHIEDNGDEYVNIWLDTCLLNIYHLFTYKWLDLWWHFFLVTELEDTMLLGLESPGLGVGWLIWRRKRQEPPGPLADGEGQGRGPERSRLIAGTRRCGQVGRHCCPRVVRPRRGKTAGLWTWSCPWYLTGLHHGQILNKTVMINCCYTMPPITVCGEIASPQCVQQIWACCFQSRGAVMSHV